MRKQTLLILMFIICVIKLTAQPYNNEWINYNQTYYKFKIANAGLYRINQSALFAAGLGNTPIEQLQLWRNGVQIALYTSIASGIPGTNDYIEFWGEKNDGKPDKALYRDPSYQISDKVSLLTDTAAYFLTAAATGAIRVADAINDVANNTLLPEPYFTNSIRLNFMDMMNPGFSTNVGEDLYSSSYDIGEVLSTWDIQLNTPYSFNINSNLYIANNNNINFIVGIVGNAALGTGPRTVNILLNNNNLISRSITDFNFETDTVSSVNPSFFTNSGIENFNVNITNTTNAYDRVVLSFAELQYPRKFNFGGASNFTFSLPSTNVGNYLEITNFNNGTSTPILYDLTNNKRYTANTATAGMLRFALPASGNRNFVLVSEDNTNITTVNTLTQRNFINFSATTNQGDYLIISNPVLSSGTALYSAYRNSTIGGNYNSKVYGIDELVDQFAYGIKKHPLAVKNFLQYAFNKFVVKPKYTFLIGRGVTYNQYRFNLNSPYADELNLVPTFGWPASDVLLASTGNTTPVPNFPIGRLSVINNQELLDYLNKIKQYDNQTTTAGQTISNKLWMKEVVHIDGVDANDPGLQYSIDSYEAGWESIIEGPNFGAHVDKFTKTNSGVTTIISQQLTNLFNSGISLLTYFGHSASSTLGYNLDDPLTYNNTGKYPIFLINGCDAGNFFDYDTGRFTARNALAELWVLAQQKGAIGFIGSTSFGLTNYLNTYTSGLYSSLSSNGYNMGVGNNLIAGNVALSGLGFNDYFARIHAEELLLEGDPAVKIYADTLPDYDIEDPQVIINPSFISVTASSFSFKAFIYNLGKSVTDSVNLLITRKYPDGSSTTLFNQKIAPVNYVDSVTLTIPILATRDKGNNSITITVNNDNKISELSSLNNSITKQVVIYEDEISPVSPYNYAIVNKSGFKFIASTADPLSAARQYAIEVDTTMLFNSSAKVTQTVSSSIGGVIEFSPSLSLVDSTVYYWRVAIVPSTGAYHWNNSSFVYLASSPSMGYNQSHLYQHLVSTFQGISLDSNTRKWSFTPDTMLLHITQSVYPTSGVQPSDFEVDLNYLRVSAAACVGHSIIFNLFDPKTLKPYYNQPVPSTIPQGSNYGYFMGSVASCDVAAPTYGVQKNFEFSYMDTTSRRKIRDFMDWIPAGTYVTARLIIYGPFNDNPYVDTYQADTSVYGVGNTLYDRLKSAGFNGIDSFVSSNPRTWAFIYQKNTPSFTPLYKLTAGLSDQIFMNTYLTYTGNNGMVTSPKFGPATAWKRLKWMGTSLDNAPGDIDSITVIGMDSAGNQTRLNTYATVTGDIDISTISAAAYPYIMLTMNNIDSTFYTPYQLKYWRLLADLAPEGALAPSIQYAFNSVDTLQPGQPVNFAIAFKNVSNMNYNDSIPVRLQVIDNNNVTQNINVTKLKPIVAGDTALVSATIGTTNFTGNNTLYLFVNPSNKPMEQYLFNNYLYKAFYVQPDNIKPVLDITFDGVHIMNGDIASAKPDIRIKLKDESKFLPLDDTALITVQLLFPDNTLHNYSYGTDTLKFIPANLSSGVNEAVAVLDPSLLMNGNYQLIVSAKDKSNNSSGAIHYTINFLVNNKPMISNVFNYPNPFTSSTAFVFTLTGSQIPSMLRIEILTITGKIVKEINKNELGTLHIGNNITDYKWDGTDQYGNKLANGVYLYRVITNLNGNQLDKYTPVDINGNNISTDQFFNSGYGKMYLMR